MWQALTEYVIRVITQQSYMLSITPAMVMKKVRRRKPPYYMLKSAPFPKQFSLKLHSVSKMIDSFYDQKVWETCMLLPPPGNSVYVYYVLQTLRSSAVKTFLELNLTRHFHSSPCVCYIHQHQRMTILLIILRKMLVCYLARGIGFSSSGRGAETISSSWVMCIIQLMFHIFLYYIFTKVSCGLKFCSEDPHFSHRQHIRQFSNLLAE